MQKLAKGKFAKRFPLWRERGTDERRWKVECCMLEPGNNGSMWHFFLCVKDKNAKAVRREACYTFPVLERKGDRQPLAGGGK